MDQVPLTKEGFVRLEGELKNLKSVQPPAVIQAIAEARAHGDLSENAEYHAAREQQSFIEGRIQELESVIGRAQVIDPKTMTGQVVKFGATVTVVDEDSDDEETYQLVGEYESDTEKGKLSIGAPVARALIGKSVGDLVKVKTPKGLRSYEILDVKYK